MKAGPRGSWHRATDGARRQWEGAVPALELVDFRYSGKPIGSDLVADGVYANAIVLGASLTDVRYLDLALEGLVYEHNGAVVATNTAAEVLGNPVELVGVAGQRISARRGLGLKAGQVVMTGSVSALVRPKGGRQRCRATYTRLGSVSARFVSTSDASPSRSVRWQTPMTLE